MVIGFGMLRCSNVFITTSSKRQSSAAVVTEYCSRRLFKVAFDDLAIPAGAEVIAAALRSKNTTLMKYLLMLSAF